MDIRFEFGLGRGSLASTVGCCRLSACVLLLARCEAGDPVAGDKSEVECPGNWRVSNGLGAKLPACKPRHDLGTQATAKQI